MGVGVTTPADEGGLEVAEGVAVTVGVGIIVGVGVLETVTVTEAETPSAFTVTVAVPGPTAL